MRPWLRWTGVAVATAAVVAMAWPAWVYVASEQMLHKRYPVLDEPLASAAPGAAKEGRRLADLYGCTSCHADDLRGEPFAHPAPFKRVDAANLTLKARTFTDADFARTVRRGVNPDGTSVWYMPSFGYVHLNDPDMAAITAYIRSLPAGGKDQPKNDPGWTGRRLIAGGEFEPGVDLVRQYAGKQPVDAGSAHVRGRYLAVVACSECHGPTLSGADGTPDLRLAAAYELKDFRHFMKTGKAAGGRELRMMSGAARKRFSHFTDEEVAAVHGYLVARVEVLDKAP